MLIRLRWLPRRLRAWVALRAARRIYRVCVRLADDPNAPADVRANAIVNMERLKPIIRDGGWRSS